MTTTAVRLSAQDAMFVYAESSSCPMHVGGMALLEGKRLRDETGRLDMPRIVRHFASRLQFAPSFRCRLMEVPFGLGHPVWADDPDFDTSAHVREKELPRPVTLSALYRFVEELQSSPLPRDKPLWDLWLVDGLEDGKVAIVQRLHHALSDGVSAVQFATLLYDLQPDAKPLPEAEARVPTPLPSPWQLITQALEHQTGVQRALGKQIVEQLRRGDIGEALGFGRLRPLGMMLDQAPHTLLTVAHPSQARRWLPIKAPLQPLLSLGRGLNATLNDVVLALVTSAVARFCEQRGSRPSELRAWIPMSTRRAGAGRAGGNQWSGVPVALPTTPAGAQSGMDDLTVRIRAVQEQTSKVKASGIAGELRELSELSESIPAVAQRFFSRTRLGCGARNLHLSVSNVPGPPVVLYVLGARVLEVHPFSIVANHSALAVTTLSYQGSLSFGLSAQAEALPDLEGLAALLEAEIAAAISHLERTASPVATDSSTATVHMLQGTAKVPPPA